MKFKLVSKIFVSSLLTLGAITFGIKEINSKDQKYLESKAATAIATYYQSVNGSGSTLLSSINTVISSQTDLGYGGLWTMYGTTDRRADGKIYDLYSDNTSFTYSSGQCGTYHNIGDCYNREHTIPKSWWGGAESAQGSDGFIVLPSDGKVNGMRSNYPYGETNSAEDYRLSGDPIGNKLGTSNNATYVSGKVFEPFDNRKGDLARTYFYAVARYLNQKSSGSNNLGAVYNWTSGDGSKVFGNGSGYNNYIKSSYANMLLKWHQEDPVSDWEIQRNNLVENAQRNRNPFIDHPSWVDLIWGGTYGSNQTNGEDTSAGTVTNGQLTPSVGITSISKTTANLTKGGNTTTISAVSSTSGSISWSTSASNICSISSGTSASGSPITLTSGNSTGIATITASITISGTTYSKTCTVTVSEPKSLSSISVSGQKTTYTVGSSFVKPTVTATYSDATTNDVTNSTTFTGFNSSSVTNSQTITVSYTESGTTKTTSYTISIVEGGQSGTYSHTFTYSEQGTGSGKTWTLSDCSDESNYWKCPLSGTESVAFFDDIFTNKTITSNITITLNIATYGSGINPSATTFRFYNSEACTSQVTASQSGSLPTSSSYTNAVYTITQANAASFTDDLAIKITKPGKQIRLKSITIAFDYETAGTPAPTLSSIAVSTAPTKTTYTAGEYFDPTGLVITKTYSDSSSETYTYANHTSEFTFTPSTSTALATNNTSVTIGCGGQTCQQAITVNAAPTRTLTSIAVQTAPTKTSYTVDDTFDPTGLVITCNYSDSTSDTYTYANHTSEFTFSPSLSTPLTTLDTSVSITYGGKSCSQAITVTTSGGSGGGSSVDPSDISGTYSLYSGELTEGNYVITFDNKAMQNSVSNNRLAYSAVTPSNDKITNPSASIVWYISQSGGYWTLFNNNVSKYAAGNRTKNQAALVSDISDSSKWTASEASTNPSKYEFVNKGNDSSSVNATLRENETYGFACYSTQTGGALTLYKQESQIIENGRYYILNSDETKGLSAQAYPNSSPSAITVSSTQCNAFDFTLKDDGAYEITTMINSVKYYLVHNNTLTSGSNTYIRVTSSPSESLKSKKWNITENGNGFYLKENTTGSVYRTLTYVSGNSNWQGYSSSGTDQEIHLVAEGSKVASTVTSINNLTCNNGITPPSTSSWSSIATAYGNISILSEKNYFKNTTANQLGTSIQQAAAKYDYIVGKYGTSNYSDFLGRNPASLNSGAVLQVAQINDNMLITVVCTMAIVSFVGFTYCLYIKKKRNRE